MFFNSKQHKIEGLMREYTEQVLSCVHSFKNAIAQYCKNPDRVAIKESFAKVHHAESKADDIRREIEVMMYSKALFPESRGDILGLLEAIDRLPNHAESAIRMIWSQYIVIPENLHGEFLQLVEYCCKSVECVVEAVEMIFKNFRNATVVVGKIDQIESEVDHIEYSIIEKVFEDQPESVSSILLRDLINHIAGISDRAENVGDRIGIIVAKRNG